MTRTKTLSLCFLVIMVCHIRAAELPNVVLIISDDQTWSDYGFMGHEVIQTPNLDRLARESVTFTRGYVPTALCRPSLATMITGLYAHQHKISGNDPAILQGAASRRARENPAYAMLRQNLIGHIDKVDTIPRLLRSKGYASHQSGKWWEGNHARGGFSAGMTHGDPKRGGRHGDDGLKIGRQGLKPVLDFIDGAGDKPFFVWYAPFLPHTPHNPPERLLKKYQTDSRPVALAKYYAMCDWFDETCGELVDFIDNKGLSSNTIIIYVTDNGWIQRTPDMKLPAGWRSQFAPRSKQSPYDGGTRTPIMIRWKGTLPPRRDEKTLVSSIDLAPTVLAAAGIDAPKRMPGVNLLDVCHGKPLQREAIFGEGFAHDIADLNDPNQSLLSRWVIHGKWKLLLNHDGKLGRYKAVHQERVRDPQLFDLLADPWENKNLATQYPEVVTRLRQEIDQWIDSTP